MYFAKVRNSYVFYNPNIPYSIHIIRSDSAKKHFSTKNGGKTFFELYNPKSQNDIQNW